ncbi:ArgE/DapE family deacylase [Salipiger mucosus]|uniref:Acetylornithine deacetylase n=1 Tax=Salipiger mucosus DSM 16094 TaxID=1123237 RepID=S9RQM2_9RHOB|nr:ArgE/DapE family deacylase [Salipiger mucosus]EPX80360.1 Acetylornithine deacetylase [Salipiger mucosus DSM 16094]
MNIQTGTLEGRIAVEVERQMPALVADLQSLVRIPSIVGNEAAAMERMKELWQEAGLDLEITRVEPMIDALREHPGFVDTQMSYEGRYSYVGVQAGTGGGRSLILNGHLDVVDPGALDAWTRDPWGAEIEGDLMYGRGAGDMKAGVVANLYALKVLAGLGLRPAGDVMLQAVIDEEAGGAGGTLSCLEQGFRADAMIATEPHPRRITVAHPGVAYFRVRTRGVQAHAAYAHDGVNAMVKMAAIVSALGRLDVERGESLRHPLIGQGSPRSCHLNVGMCHAGEWPSSVPAEAVIDCRIGFIPGESLEEIRALVARTVAEAGAGDAWMEENPAEIEWFGWQTDPWEQDPEASFVQIVKAEAERVAGETLPINGGTGGIDSRFSAYYGMDAVVTGPRAWRMHGTDEAVSIASIAETVRILAQSVLAWCGTADGEGRA